MMVRQELVVEHSVEREAAMDVAEGDARAGAISVLVMQCVSVVSFTK